jgi:hypothetical protein
MGRLTNQVILASRSNVPKNLLEHPPPWHQEHSGTTEKVMEALTDLDEPTYSVRGPLAM